MFADLRREGVRANSQFSLKAKTSSCNTLPIPYIPRRRSRDRIKQSAGHRRWSAGAGFPCLDEFAGNAERFGEEALAESEPVTELMDGGSVEAGWVGDFDGFHRQLIGSAAKAVAKLGQALDEQIAQRFFCQFSHGNIISLAVSAGLRSVYSRLATPHKRGR